MKKSDLKTGMRARFGNGKIYVVVHDYETSNYGHQDIVFISASGFMVGSDYSEDLLYTGDDRYDITDVYAQPRDYFFLDVEQFGKLLWKRPEPKEMTLSEIETELGCPVKIIKED